MQQEPKPDGVLQKILVVQQYGSAASKIEGMRRFGEGIELTVASIDRNLPPLIDDGAEFLPDPAGFDLVLDFLKHPDLSYDLADACSRSGVPAVASGKKHRFDGVHTPPT